jgi:hypothetical protein
MCVLLAVVAGIISVSLLVAYGFPVPVLSNNNATKETPVTSTFASDAALQEQLTDLFDASTITIARNLARLEKAASVGKKKRQASLFLWGFEVSSH